MGQHLRWGSTCGASFVSLACELSLGQSHRGGGSVCSRVSGLDSKGGTWGPTLNSMRFLAASLLLLGLVPVAAQTAPQLNLQDLKNAEALGADLYTNSGATGLVLVVVRGDKVFIHGYGETAPGSHTAPNEDSVIRICSLTKIFTTDVLAKLVATVRCIWTIRCRNMRLRAPWFRRKAAPITLLDLATHTAGLDREIGTAPRHTPHFTYPDFETRWQWLSHAELKFTPGTEAFYSNVGFDLLSDALADAAHMPYATLLWTRTLKPLQYVGDHVLPHARRSARG